MSRPTYAAACRAFRWSDHLRALGWTENGDVSLAHTIVDRHAVSGRIALRWFGKDGSERALGFDELAVLASRCANLLREIGVRPGDRVAGFLPRVPETIAAMIGTWKAGAIYVPIFTGFGPDAIEYRLRHSGARVLCTHWEYRSRVPEPVSRDARIVTIAGSGALPPGDISFRAAVEAQPAHADAARTRRDAPAVVLYTSGSTGPPKGVAIAANFLLAVHPYMVYGVDLRPDDVFWPTGDPAWGYGLVCYMLALAMGIGVVSQEAAPSAQSCLERLAKHGVTNLATTPTLLRSIMALGADTVRRGPVRVARASSCGEPLNAEVVTFFREHWGITVMDQYGSSEFGLPIGNLNAVEMAVKPGSMGLPLPACEMAVVGPDREPLGDGAVGQIAMRRDPVGYYALGYWDDAERTRELCDAPWMTIGDLARRDADGYFWFEGRADDVIKSSGYRIGPFEIESAILRHPAVAEAAVAGVPDPLRGQIVKAFVVLKPGRVPHAGLDREITDVVKQHVGSHQAPRAVEFLAELPKTESGKIQRFLLRQR